MKTLVTGAAGFVGSNVVRELLKKGSEVKTLILKGSDTSNLEALKNDIEFADGNILDKASIKSALHGCDTVYHIAALYSLWKPDPKIFYDINVNGTKNVLEASLEHGVNKVVYTSTIGVIGAYGPDSVVDETADFNLWDTGDHYVRSKHLAEREAIKFFEKGLPVVIVNSGVAIGIRDVTPTPSGKSIIDIVTGKMPAYIDGGINVADVEDIAQGHVLAEEKGKPGERYILGNKNLTIKEFSELVAKIAGVKPPSFKMPYLPLLGLGFVFENISKLTKKEPQTSVAAVKLGSRYMFCNSSKAVNELGLNQTPTEETIEKSITWFREHGYV